MASDLLDDYVHRFLGYGNPEASLWHVGMEEAGNPETMPKRLSIWQQRGSKIFEDSAEFKLLIDPENIYFRADNRVQFTLNRMIRLEFGYTGLEILTALDVRRYQQAAWGKFDGKSAAIELSAVPRRSLGQDYPYSTKRAFNEFLRQERTDFIAENIKKYRPRDVVFYGTSKKYTAFWKVITEKCMDQSTNFHIVEHPNSRKWNLDRYHGFGKLIP
ncbi:hypothetical protein RYZ27_01465 [Hyphomonas sp. FCG-A18]|uniref:hypothetical protein n=1 Tax=Hyphomonas sp. FCG-A18 TaxID=3080019 RepID=UPI002B2BA6ED|nr:hypothetical protein RYZ27_01465 [Hyphomonas sp. FCG-A18]